MQKNLVSYCIVAFLTISLVSCDSQDDAANDAKVQTENIDSLVMMYPDSADILLRHGKHYYAQFRFDMATPSASKAFRLDSTNFEARLLYANVLNNKPDRTLNEILIARRHFEVIKEKNPKNLEALVGIASTYTVTQDYDQSFKYINEALRIDPRYRDAYIMKGTNYLQLNKIELAKSSWETAVQQDPEFWFAYTNLGNLYLSEGNPICIEYYRTANQIKENDVDMMYNLAYAYQQFNQPDESAQLYRDMFKVDTTFAMAKFQQGWIKQEIKNDLDSAMIFYREAILIEPRFIEAWHNLGLCHERQGNKTQALKAYAKALKYNPDYTLSREAADALK